MMRGHEKGNKRYYQKGVRMTDIGTVAHSVIFITEQALHFACRIAYGIRTLWVHLVVLLRVSSMIAI